MPHCGQGVGKAWRTVVNLLDLVRPIAVALVGFTLMEDDALDDAVFLGLLGHINQSLVRIATIIIDDVLEPAGLGRHIALVKRRIERHDTAARNGHNHDADLDLRVELFDKRAAEVIRRAKTTMIVRQRRNRVVPRAQLPSLEIVDCRKHLESRIDRLVLRLDSTLALHVGLAEGEIDVKIGIWGSECSRNHQGGKAQMQEFHLNLLKQHNTVTGITARDKITFFGATSPSGRSFPL